MSDPRIGAVFRLLATGAVALVYSHSLHAETFYIPEGDVAALQAALDASANNGETDYIDLQGKVFTLTAPQPGTQSGLVVQGEPETDDDNTNHTWIQNGTIERSTAPGTPDFRLVKVNAPPGVAPSITESSVHFENLVMRNGRFNAGNVSSNDSGGGAIEADWQINIRYSSLQNNEVAGNGSGGAVRATSYMNIWNSEFIGNSAVSAFPGTAGRGGAVYTNARGYITGSLFDRNRANAGGAFYDDVFNTDDVGVNRSLFTGNSASNLGGGIWSRSRRLSVTNSTMVGNSASGGGAIYSQRPESGNSIVKFTIEFSTIVNNTATSGSGGGGILSQANFFNGLEFISSIVGDNKGSDGTTDNCAVINNAVSIAPVTSSISDDASCNSSLGVFTIVDDIYSVVEAQLASNGGQTQTLALTLNSPAIDASTADRCPGVDQRQASRLDDNAGNTCDIGAYELTLNDIPVIDSDGDGIPDEGMDGQAGDNCPAIMNADQNDADQDGIGDVCDADRDGDGIPQFDADTETADNCPDIANENQQDTDDDGFGDVCDNTPDGEDADGDGIGDAFDNCPTVNSTDLTDTDSDGDGNVCDSDDDDDGTPDVDDDYPLDPARQIADEDEDGIRDSDDNCLSVVNADQINSDDDELGDACDSDDDNDGIPDVDDAFPLDPDRSTLDQDGDGISDDEDNCPSVTNADQINSDDDELGNACDTDDDNDGTLDVDDAYPLDPDRTFLDQDGDGIRDSLDNCPTTANADQSDADDDGLGDVCDDTDDSASVGINSDVTQAASDLASILATTSGQVQRILSGASRRLDWALNSRYWTSENELSSRYGARVFTYASLAVNEIERVADSRHVDAGLRAELDVVSSAILDGMRSLATNRIAEATAANGSRWRIARANIALRLGDRDRSRDRLRDATIDYGYAWRWADAAS
ncbi:thrombospondin type 3 repeat-containing protein [Granulosicoccus sp. 3-233]|uniref:thrombospondin type 3 repeat-containing protein n=1 Tax=Granulosicoccus sp. 3-233 TaxID=3417969 RepID=UPI003D34349D